MKRAANCEECENFLRTEDKVCKKGHRPRFYPPKTMRAATLGDFGWKRRCSDFTRDWRVFA